MIEMMRTKVDIGGEIATIITTVFIDSKFGEPFRFETKVECKKLEESGMDFNNISPCAYTATTAHIAGISFISGFLQGHANKRE